jgi:hypothetical protein
MVGQPKDAGRYDFDAIALATGDRWHHVAEASEEGQVAGDDSDGRSQLVPHELKQFLEVFEIGEFPFDIEVGFLDFSDLR